MRWMLNVCIIHSESLALTVYFLIMSVYLMMVSFYWQFNLKSSDDNQTGLCSFLIQGGREKSTFRMTCSVFKKAGSRYMVLYNKVGCNVSDARLNEIHWKRNSRDVIKHPHFMSSTHTHLSRSFRYSVHQGWQGSEPLIFQAFPLSGNVGLQGTSKFTEFRPLWGQDTT